MNTEAIIREHIDKTVHLSLATVTGNQPWVCEVHFAYDDRLNLYFRSLTSRRHSQEITTNPNVAGNIIDKHELGAPVVGLYFEGTASLLEPGPEQDTAAKCIETRLKISDTLAEAKRPDGHQFYKITVTNWYSFGAPKGQKLKLEWNGGRHS
jgi:uncharacterized protein YhbP (UPF0306 family)